MNKKLGELIRTIRKEKGISLRGLADQINVSYANISYIENGKIKTSTAIIKSIAKAIDYDLDRLLALADTVDNDVKNIINKKPRVVTDFLRAAKNLTNDDWLSLTKQVETINKNRKGL